MRKSIIYSKVIELSMTELIEEKVWDFVDIPCVKYNEKDYYNHHLKKYGLVKEVIENLGPKRILDIGVATGIFYSLLPDFHNNEVFGIDIVPEFMPILKKRGIKAQLCNIEKESVPSPNESFDLVICDSIFEHTLKPKHLTTEIHRVLKPGGGFIVVVPNATSIIRRWNHLRGRNIFGALIDNLYFRDYLSRCSVFYSEKELSLILEGSQLVVERVEYINETSHDVNKLVIKAIRLLGALVPQFRDVIFLVGHKNL